MSGGMDYADNDHQKTDLAVDASDGRMAAGYPFGCRGDAARSRQQKRPPQYAGRLVGILRETREPVALFPDFVTLKSVIL